MKHDEAIRSNAAERYVSHKLSPAEQEAFEGHFFDCQACADQVRLELTFAANVRAVSRDLRAGQLKANPWKKCRDWLRLHPIPALSFAANFAMAAGLGFVVLTGLHESSRPRLIASYFAPGPAKGAEAVHLIAPGETIYQVRFVITGPRSPSYAYEVLDAAGKRESSGSLKAPSSEDDSLNLQIPVESLRAGVHTLVVRGDPGGEIVSWSKFRTAR